MSTPSATGLAASLDLAPIGNCAASALIDRRGRFVWACVPRVDGDPVFCSLLSGRDADAQDERDVGFWDVEVEDAVSTEQDYLRNTPVLRTVITDERGASLEIIDFAPRRRTSGRTYRPIAFVRLLRPLSGAPRIRIRMRPARDWGAAPRKAGWGSNHIRYRAPAMDMRLTTNGAVGHILEERTFRLEDDLAMFFGPDEPFAGDALRVCEEMRRDTEAYWRDWVRTLAVPLDWQAVVIRAAITLKLCVHEETGAIVAALTTSIPEAPHSGRNWDYRYCWLRDAYYVVRALNRLGAADLLENYLSYLRNLIDNARGGPIQPVYGVGYESQLEERVVKSLPGYRGMGPVRAGNQAYVQHQYDVYGQIILSSAHAFFDERLLRPASLADFEGLERVGQLAFDLHDHPDAGLWEFRTRAAVHTYSAAMCWAACDRLGNIAASLGLDARANLWNGRAAAIRATIEREAFDSKSGRYSAAFGAASLDASLLQLVELKYIEPDDPRQIATLKAVEAGLRRGDNLLRYAAPDDFGAPETAFNFCTFWFIEALHLDGRTEEARRLFSDILAHRTRAGLLSEDIAFTNGELWGNYPQTYSLVGMINCATMLSLPWNTVR